MPEIQLNVRGQIVKGRHAGQWMTVQDDTQQSGGYRIVIEPDAVGQNGGDYWIQTGALARAFAEAEWEVDWGG